MDLSIISFIDWLIEQGFWRLHQHSISYLEDSFTIKRPNQQYQSTEGKNATKVKKTQKKSKQHKIQQSNKHANIQKKTENSLVYNNTMG